MKPPHPGWNATATPGVRPVLHISLASTAAAVFAGGVCPSLLGASGDQLLQMTARVTMGMMMVCRDATENAPKTHKTGSLSASQPDYSAYSGR